VGEEGLAEVHVQVPCALPMLLAALYARCPSLSHAEHVEVFVEAEGRWAAGVRVPGSTLSALGSLVGRGAYGVVYDDGRSDLVSCMPSSGSCVS
jgi:hypothetical protein